MRGRRQIPLPDGRKDGQTDGAMAISAVAAITSIQITLSKAAFDAAVSLYRATIALQFSGTLCAIITDAV